ncbi:hypothetical protein BDC45DRAFT_537725 [Circinella umbellata]|nr:hypothetical protein BDC45DRAFT_537725 [Circinella umbellata]
MIIHPKLRRIKVIRRYFFMVLVKLDLKQQPWKKEVVDAELLLIVLLFSFRWGCTKFLGSKPSLFRFLGTSPLNESRSTQNYPKVPEERINCVLRDAVFNFADFMKPAIDGNFPVWSKTNKHIDMTRKFSTRLVALRHPVWKNYPFHSMIMDPQNTGRVIPLMKSQLGSNEKENRSCVNFQEKMNNYLENYKKFGSVDVISENVYRRQQQQGLTQIDPLQQSKPYHDKKLDILFTTEVLELGICDVEKLLTLVTQKQSTKQVLVLTWKTTCFDALLGLNILPL